MKDEKQCAKVYKNGKRCKEKREPNPDGLLRIMCKKHRQKTSELEPQIYESAYTSDRGHEMKMYTKGFIR